LVLHRELSDVISDGLLGLLLERSAVMSDDVFVKHQIKIARATLKMNDVGVAVMGGMSKDEAREILRKHAKDK
jgi:hypothetical protein